LVVSCHSCSAMVSVSPTPATPHIRSRHPRPAAASTSPPACISNSFRPRSGRPPAERPPLLGPPAIAATPSNCAARRPRAGRRPPLKSPVLLMASCFGPLADLYSSPSYMAVLGPRCDEILRNPCSSQPICILHCLAGAKSSPFSQFIALRPAISGKNLIALKVDYPSICSA
jgi:hypothetical protein